MAMVQDGIGARNRAERLVPRDEIGAARTRVRE